MTTWIEELDRLEKDATAAPWKDVSPGWPGNWLSILAKMPPPGESGGCYDVCKFNCEDDEAYRNAQFMSRLRNHARKLIDSMQQVRDMRVLAEKLEYSGNDVFGIPCCPICDGNESDGHESGCILGELLL